MNFVPIYLPHPVHMQHELLWKLCDPGLRSFFNPAATGLSCHPPAARGHIFVPIFFLSISPQRKGAEA